VNLDIPFKAGRDTATTLFIGANMYTSVQALVLHSEDTI